MFLSGGRLKQVPIGDIPARKGSIIYDFDSWKIGEWRNDYDPSLRKNIIASAYNRSIKIQTRLIDDKLLVRRI